MKIRIPRWLVEPNHTEPLGQLDTWDGRMPEDFASDARADVQTPKRGA